MPSTSRELIGDTTGATGCLQLESRVPTSRRDVAVGDVVAFEFLENSSCRSGVGTVTKLGDRVVEVSEWAASSDSNAPTCAASVLHAIALEERRSAFYAQRVDELRKALIVQRENAENQALEARQRLQDAREQVSAIDECHLREIRTYRSPPLVIQQVLEATISLLDGQVIRHDWDDLHGMVRHADFIPRILRFQPSSIRGDLKRAVERTFLSDPGFSAEHALKGSRAVAPLRQWIVAALGYQTAKQALEDIAEQASGGSLKRALEDLHRTRTALASLREELKAWEVYHGRNDKDTERSLDRRRFKDPAESASSSQHRIVLRCGVRRLFGAHDEPMPVAWVDEQAGHNVASLVSSEAMVDERQRLLDNVERERESHRAECAELRSVIAEQLVTIHALQNDLTHSRLSASESLMKADAALAAHQTSTKEQQAQLEGRCTELRSKLEQYRSIQESLENERAVLEQQILVDDQRHQKAVSELRERASSTERSLHDAMKHVAASKKAHSEAVLRAEHAEQTLVGLRRTHEAELLEAQARVDAAQQSAQHQARASATEWQRHVEQEREVFAAHYLGLASSTWSAVLTFRNVAFQNVLAVSRSTDEHIRRLDEENGLLLADLELCEQALQYQHRKCCALATELDRERSERIALQTQLHGQATGLTAELAATRLRNASSDIPNHDAHTDETAALRTELAAARRELEASQQVPSDEAAARRELEASQQAHSDETAALRTELAAADGALCGLRAEFVLICEECAQAKSDFVDITLHQMSVDEMRSAEAAERVAARARLELAVLESDAALCLRGRESSAGVPSAGPLRQPPPVFCVTEAEYLSLSVLLRSTHSVGDEVRQRLAEENSHWSSLVAALTRERDTLLERLADSDQRSAALSESVLRAERERLELSRSHELTCERMLSNVRALEAQLSTVTNEKEEAQAREVRLAARLNMEVASQVECEVRSVVLQQRLAAQSAQESLEESARRAWSQVKDLDEEVAALRRFAEEASVELERRSLSEDSLRGHVAHLTSVLAEAEGRCRDAERSCAASEQAANDAERHRRYYLRTVRSHLEELVSRCCQWSLVAAVESFGKEFVLHTAFSPRDAWHVPFSRGVSSSTPGAENLAAGDQILESTIRLDAMLRSAVDSADLRLGAVMIAGRTVFEDSLRLDDDGSPTRGLL